VGGGAGAPGGGSVGLFIANDTPVTLVRTTVRSGNGGAGGAGQAGQAGGAGGLGPSFPPPPAPQTGFGHALDPARQWRASNGARGGNGGDGGQGGPGGGGAGGGTTAVLIRAGSSLIQGAGAQVATGQAGAGGPSPGNRGMNGDRPANGIVEIP
jgi:hypothetical protein